MLTVLILLWLFLAYWTRQNDWPVLSILGRWVRWALAACLVAYGLESLHWGRHSTGARLCMGALIWFWGESIYRWWLTGLMSRGAAGLFARFVRASDSLIPISRIFLFNQKRLLESGLHLKEMLWARFNPPIQLHAWVYENPPGTVRAICLMVPRPGQGFFIFYSLHAQDTFGNRYTVDNFFSPSALPYPPGSQFCRNPWIRSIDGLLKAHQKLVATKTLMPFELAPCEELNHWQQKLEQTSIQQGLLFPLRQQPEHGKLTSEGRYQLWKAYFWMYYFGKA